MAAHELGKLQLSRPSRPTGRSKPIAYEAVARGLSRATAARHYREGDRLPTEAERVATYGVSRQTIRHAMANLRSEGLVVRAHGRRTFPASGANEHLRHIGSVVELMVLPLDTDLELLAPLGPPARPVASGSWKT